MCVYASMSADSESDVEAMGTGISERGVLSSRAAVSQASPCPPQRPSLARSSSGGGASAGKPRAVGSTMATQRSLVCVQGGRTTMSAG